MLTIQVNYLDGVPSNHVRKLNSTQILTQCKEKTLTTLDLTSNPHLEQMSHVLTVN